MLKNEIWKDIKGYEGVYQVSSLGKIKSLDRIIIHKNGKMYNKKGKLLSPRCNNKRNGYYEISLYKNNVSKKFKLHRLISECFILNKFNKPEINHIDGDKSNNNIENLEWVTSKENKKHGWDNKLYNAKHKMKPIKCMETNEIFESVIAASIKMNIDRRFLFRHLSKQIKKVKGFSFEYIL